MSDGHITAGVRDPADYSAEETAYWEEQYHQKILGFARAGYIAYEARDGFLNGAESWDNLDEIVKNQWFAATEKILSEEVKFNAELHIEPMPITVHQVASRPDSEGVFRGQ